MSDGWGCAASTAGSPPSCLAEMFAHVVRELDQLLAPVVRLAHDALLGLGDVVLEPDRVLEPERPPDLGRDLEGLVVDRVAPVEPDERRRAVLAGEQLGPQERPQAGERVVVAHEDRDLELDVDAQAVEQVAGQDRARVEVEDLLHAVRRVVVEVLVHPQQGMVVGLPDPAEVAGDRRRAVEVDVRAVRALGVERLDDARADDLHRRRHRRQVAVRLLLLHLADPDPASRHERPIGDRAPGRGDDPGEVLEGADLEGHGHVVAEGHRVGPVAQHAAPVVGDAHEGVPVALLRQPLEIGEVVRPGLPHPVQQRGQRARLPGLAVDLLRGAVAGHDGQQVVDDPGIRIEQERVEVVKPVCRGSPADPAGRCPGSCDAVVVTAVSLPARVGRRVPVAQSSSCTSSSYSSSFMPNQLAGAGKVRSVTSPT